jgi:hypothetical protein
LTFVCIIFLNCWGSFCWNWCWGGYTHNNPRSWLLASFCRLSLVSAVMWWCGIGQWEALCLARGDTAGILSLSDSSGTWTQSRCCTVWTTPPTLDILSNKGPIHFVPTTLSDPGLLC